MAFRRRILRGYSHVRRAAATDWRRFFVSFRNTKGNECPGEKSASPFVPRLCFHHAAHAEICPPLMSNIDQAKRRRRLGRIAARLWPNLPAIRPLLSSLHKTFMHSRAITRRHSGIKLMFVVVFCGQIMPQKTDIDEKMGHKTREKQLMIYTHHSPVKTV